MKALSIIHDKKGIIIMLKKIILIVFILGLLPNVVSAHSQLISSNPTDGQVITNEVSEIMLTFNTTIEEISTMNLRKDEQEINFDQILIENQEMTGSLSQPLEIGTYIVGWKIVGEDGHPIEGSFSFSVQVAQAGEETNKADDTETVKETSPKEPEEKQSNETKEKPDNSIATVLIVILGLVLAIGIGFLFKKKR